MDFIDNISDLKTKLKEHLGKVEAIRKLPEYEEFIKYKNELNLFADFVKNKRMKKTIDFLELLVEDDEKLIGFVDRIKKLEKRLSDIQWKKGYCGSNSNIIEFVFETISNHCKKVQVTDDFGQSSFTIGKYTIELYSGQGEHGYAIYKQERIY